MAFYLPKKISGHLLRLSHNYSTDEASKVLQNILESARIHVAEDVDDKDYNGGTTGHGLVLYIPLEVLGPISPQNQNQLIDKLWSDLRAIIGNVPGEYISYIRFELNDESDETFKNSSTIFKKPVLPADTLTIWKTDMIRVFISHRDQYKAEARELADALEPFGFTCFVAHDTITPMSEWRLEIMKGLQSMEIMLVFLTDDFHDSIWTNQEVGFALGDNKPVVSLKLGSKAPQGFIDHIQALKADIDKPASTAQRLVPLLAEAARSKERIQTAIVRAFTESPDWGETTKRFDRMKTVVEKLSDNELQMIINAFTKNDQLHGASYLKNSNNRLINFLKDTTDRLFRIEEKRLIDVEMEELDIPI
jgi:hypothetical protein